MDYFINISGVGVGLQGPSKKIKFKYFRLIGPNMAKRWSKLQKQVERLFAQKLSLRIQCTEIRTTSKNEGALAEVLGVFTVRLGKEEIWSFPKQFIDYWTEYPDGGNQYSFGVSDINIILREYLDTPKDELLEKEFKRDYFGITNILKAADRRIGLKRIVRHFEHSDQAFVQKVIEARIALTRP
jgi:hypothetical protein